MADRTQARVANHNDIASDDPFAELTRIMGFDPREPVQRQAAPQSTPEQAEDFDIDLEKELMGEFEAYQEEPVAAAQPGAAVPQLAAEPHTDETVGDDFVASMEQEFRAAEPAVPAVAGPVEDDAPDFDFAAAAESLDERAFDEPVAIDDEVQPQEAEAPTGQQFEDYEAAMSDVDFGDLDFAGETSGEAVAAVEPVVVEQISAEPVAEESVASAVEPSAAAAGDDFDAHFDTAMADVDMDFSAHDESPVVAAEATEAEAVEVEPAQSEQTFMPTFGHHAQPADVVAENETDFDVDLEDAFTDESEAVAIAAAEPEAVEPVAVVTAEAPSVAAQDRSLEDELNALLGRMTARPAAAPSAEAEAWRPQFAAAPVTIEQPAQRDVEADLDASLVAEFAAADVEAVDETPHAEDDIDFDTDAFDAAMAGGMDTPDEEPVEQVEEDPVEALKWTAPAAAAAAATATFAQPMRAWSRGNPVAPSSQPYSAPAQPYSASVQQFSAPTQLTPVQPSASVEPRMAAAPQPVVQPVAASWQKPAQPVREDVPDIETMDVPERVVALADDLDIPEVPFEQDKPETSNFDELDAEFSTLLNEMLPGESAAPVKTAQYDDDAGNGYKRDRVEMPAYADSPQAAAAAAAYADLGYQGYDSRSAARTMPAADQIADDGFDYDPDLEEGMTIPDAAAAEAEEAPRRRGLLIAALVGAVAVVGGVGAFAFSGGGSSSEAPAIVKADNQPMKVKPENPGGTVIPNQDNKVYDAVAKGARPAVPTQPKLVANAEEPVDVIAKEQAEQAERTAAFAGTDDGEGEAQNAAQQPVKSEDRVAQVAQENAGTQEGALVTPRKVRTMVVKPDGTLAPREEPAAAPVTASEPADPTPQRVAQDQTGTVPQVGAGESMLKPAKPSTVAATPSAAPLAPQRPSDQPVDIAGEVKPQAQQQQQVASAQPQAPAPTAGGWSMQIASQPTVEGAQSTYQDLARRYSNVLAGRSANIVKADVAGKGTFYRVRVMAQSREDAIKLCTSYKAAGGNCFVSK